MRSRLETKGGCHNLTISNSLDRKRQQVSYNLGNALPSPIITRYPMANPAKLTGEAPPQAVQRAARNLRF
ncbi:MAG: hypothetical protein AAFY11_04600, partial [Cyanobacteria bacterium J06641_5]